MHVQHDAADAVGRLYAGGADTLRAATRYGLSGRRKSNSMVAMTSVLSLITATSLLRRFRFDTRERAIHDVSHDAHRLNVCQECGETHEDCPRNTFGASHKNARQTVTVVRRGKWVVDDVSCRDHYLVRQGGCEGFEEPLRL
jgi:hypothetical protein